MSDAQIIQRMNEDRAWEQYQESLQYAQSGEEQYDACLNEADMELQEHYDAIAKVVICLQKKYGFGINEILKDMVIPSIEAEVLR